MSALVAVLFLYLSTHQILADEEPTETLVWPKEYHLKAERLDLQKGLVEPMELWSSAKKKRSRVDYYDGTTSKYYVWPMDDKPGYVYNVYPYTTEVEENQKECQSSTKKANNYKFLLNAKAFKYAGETRFEGSWAREWVFKTNYKEMYIDVTIYTRKGDGYDVPIQMAQKLYNVQRGNLMTHVVTNYFNFDTDPDPKNETFDASAAGCMSTGVQGEDLHTDLKFLHHAFDSHVDSAFHSFKKHHQKQYNSLDEHEMRKQIFAKNWAFINSHNSKKLSYRLQVNQFADYTPEETAWLRGTRPSTERGTHPFLHSDAEVKVLAEQLPEEYNMLLEGYISPIKSQGSCGSCWAFSVTAAVEGALARSNGGRLLDLSEQSIVDCAWGFKNLGCNGGKLDGAFRYILKHGIPTEEEYGAYLEQDGYCHRDNVTEKYGIRGFAKVTPLNPQALKVALYKYGPVAATINFSEAMKFYSSGIFYDPDCNKSRRNHGVTVVGYGTKEGTDYWIVRNSHGRHWGEAGYMLLSAADNNCLILTEPFYPVV